MSRHETVDVTDATPVATTAALGGHSASGGADASSSVERHIDPFNDPRLRGYIDG